MRKKWLYIMKPSQFSFQEIHCNLEFSYPLSVNKDLVINTNLSSQHGDGVLVNDVNVTQLQSEVVFSKGQSYVISGQKTFAAGFFTHNLRVNRE